VPGYAQSGEVGPGEVERRGGTGDNDASAAAYLVAEYAEPGAFDAADLEAADLEPESEESGEVRSGKLITIGLSPRNGRWL
jgi:hypothetical protein